MDAIIHEALCAFGISNAAYEILRHNENITCKVTDHDTRYVLRIHCPTEGFQVSLIAGMDDMALFQSEIDLLRHMRRNGFPELQEPMATPQGEYSVRLKNGAPAMLLSWAEGEQISADDGKRYPRDIGRLAVRIHRAAEGFRGARLRYDGALCDRMMNELRRAIALRHLSEEAGAICIRELHAVKKAQNRQKTCIIHSDLGFGNILLTDRGLVPIDFSLSGYGSLAQEAGMLMSNYQDDESIAELLAGFADAGMPIDPKDAEVFLSYSVLLFITSQHDRFYSEEWFADAMKRWCNTLFTHE